MLICNSFLKFITRVWTSFLNLSWSFFTSSKELDYRCTFWKTKSNSSSRRFSMKKSVFWSFILSVTSYYLYCKGCIKSTMIWRTLLSNWNQTVSGDVPAKTLNTSLSKSSSPFLPYIIWSFFHFCTLSDNYFSFSASFLPFAEISYYFYLAVEISVCSSNTPRMST